MKVIMPQTRKTTVKTFVAAPYDAAGLLSQIKGYLTAENVAPGSVSNLELSVLPRSDQLMATLHHLDTPENATVRCDACCVASSNFKTYEVYVAEVINNSPPMLVQATVPVWVNNVTCLIWIGIHERV